MPYLILVKTEGTGAATGPDFNTVKTIDNPNPFGTTDTDLFGGPVDVSDNYALVGAIYEDESGQSNSGKAYIFNPSTGALLQTLDNPNDYSTAAGDEFGGSVAVNDSYAVVTATYEDAVEGNSRGKVYIFNPSTGGLVHTIDSPDPVNSGAFGGGLGLSDTHLIIGTLNGSGKDVWIFNPSTGGLVQTITNPDPDGDGVWNGNFGDGAVDISTSYAIVGAKTQAEKVSGGKAGRAFIFNPTTGALLQTLNHPNPASFGGQDEYFGAAVAITDNYAVVGAPRYVPDPNTQFYGGEVYVFNPSTGALLHTLQNPNDYGSVSADVFGASVDVSGDKIIVGAPGEKSADGSNSGKVYIFNASTGALENTLQNPNAYGTQANDQFGESVGISGSYAIAAARFENDAGGNLSGKAYIYG